MGLSTAELRHGSADMNGLCPRGIPLDRSSTILLEMTLILSLDRHEQNVEVVKEEYEEQQEMSQRAVFFF